MKRFRIKYSLDSLPDLNQTDDLQASGPVQALNQFHNSMQMERNIKPSSYEILSLSMVYGSCASHKTGENVVDSKFDLPRCSNPTMRKSVEIAPIQESMF